MGIISTYILLDGESFIGTLAEGFLEIVDEEKLQIEQAQRRPSLILYAPQDARRLREVFENVPTP